MDKPNLAFLGRSIAVQRLREQVERHAELFYPLLIWGEEGVGKQETALAIQSKAPQGSVLVRLDMTDPRVTFPEPEAAYGGLHYIVLEGIGESSAPVQDRCWRWIRQGTGTDPSHRLLSTCTGSLARKVAQNRFRADLFLKVAVTTIEVPPLRERKEDVPFLVRSLLAEATKANNEPEKMFTAEAMRSLLDYSWPGNLAELRAEVLRRIASTKERIVQDSKIFSEPLALAAESNLRQSWKCLAERIENYEKSEIYQALKLAGGMRDRAAAMLGIDRRTLQRKMRRWERRKKFSGSVEASP